MTNDALAELLAGSSSASLDAGRSDYPIIRVANGEAEAAVALHGAHVLDFRVGEEPPLLYLSPESRFQRGVPIRGGVPVCWPWFGAHPTDPGKPFHGFARNLMWELAGVAEPSESVTELAFRLPPERIPAELFSPAVELSLVVTIGSFLELALTTENRGQRPLVVGGALHTYFAVSEATEATVEGLAECFYFDKTRDWQRLRQTGAIRFDGEVDRVFVETPPVAKIVDPGWKRTIRIEAEGSRSTVVWNPASETARAMKDLPDDGYRHFVCVETANARDDLHTLEPGVSHTLGCRISSEAT